MDSLTIINFLKDWGMAIIIGLLIAAYVLYQKRKELIKRKKLREVVGTPAQQIQRVEPIVQNNYLEQFEEATAEETEDPEMLIHEVGKMDGIIKKTDDEVEKKIKNDLEHAKKTLAEIKNTKEKLREYGQRLASIYNKFKEREESVAMTVAGLERVQKKPQGQRTLNNINPPTQ